MPTRCKPIFALSTLFALLSMAVTAAQADPVFWEMQGFKTDFSKTTIDLARVLSGGPPKDGIPSIDAPIFETVGETTQQLGDSEPVVSVVISGDARAYPLRILTWHEIVNDTVGGVPIAVTYCPLCNSAPVFLRTVSGRVVDFGTTGKLKDSNLIMYDRQTESWWQQFTGEAIVGDLVGERLELVPARLESWADFRRAHPDGQVLVPNNPGFRSYGRNPYVGYDTSDRPFLYDGQLPEGIDPMQRVVIVPRPKDGPGEPILISMATLAEAGSMTARGHSFTWRAGQSSALDQASIGGSRDVGTVAVNNAQGQPVAYDVTFAFVAHAFHPGTPIIGR